MNFQQCVKDFTSIACAVFLGVSTSIRSEEIFYSGATIIDGNGGTPIVDGVLVTKGKFILSVGPKGSIDIPKNAKIINVEGQHIVPGFIDGNVHFFPWPSWTYIEFLARYEGRFEEIIEEGAQIALSYGVTTAFDSMGPVIPGLNVRDGINRGEILGPRLFIAGNIVGSLTQFYFP